MMRCFFFLTQAWGAFMIDAEVLKMRDPFRMPDLLQEHVSSVDPLQKYAVTSYALVGIFEDEHKVRALILDPDDGVHQVVEKAKIGNKGGYIRKIRFSSLVVREKKVDLVGQEIDNDVVLELLKKKREHKKEEDVPKSSFVPMRAPEGGKS